MRLTLCNDDGEVLNTWYVPDEETPAKEIEARISNQLPVYDSQSEWLELKEEFSKPAAHSAPEVAVGGAPNAGGTT